MIKIKSAPTGVSAPKNTNPNCRQTNLIELEYLYHNHYSEFALLPNSKMIMAKKGYNYPIKKKIPLILLLNLFGIFIVSHFLRFVNMFDEFYMITFREAEKSLPCARGGGTATP